MRILASFVLALVSLAGTTAFGQGLSWSSPQISPGAGTPGGVPGRPAIAGVFSTQGNQVYAFETTTSGSSVPLIRGYGNGSPTSTTFNGGGAVSFQGSNPTSNASPALTQINGTLYLAYTDQSGFNHIISSLDNGSTWTGPSALSGLPTGTNDNPTITADPASNTIFTAYTNGQTYTPIVCKWTPGGAAPSCTQYYSLRTENFNPGIAFWNGIVYLGYEDRGDSHCLYFYKYTPATTAMTNWQPIGCNEQTSAGPSLAVYNNALYVGFRTNDSSAKFTIRVSTDGNTLNFRQQPGFTMDGYPQLVTINANGRQYLMNIYPRSGFLNTTLGQ